MTHEPPNTPPPLENESGAFSEIAPGQWAWHSLEGTPPPRHILARVIDDGYGRHRLEPALLPAYVRVSPSMEIAKLLNLHGLNYPALRRLCFAGFLDYIEPTPGHLYVSADSVLEHLRATEHSRTDGGTWWTPARRARWMEVHGL